MKNKTTLISQLGMIAFCIGLVSLANPAYALRTTYPPLRGNAHSDSNEEARAKSGNAKMTAKDKEFMMKAAKGGMMEVEMGKVAAQNGKHPDVKKFGNRMVADHGKANSELMALAKEEGVQLPAAKGAGKWKSDKDYIDMMVKDHEKDLAEFQAEAQNGTDADLKKFADNTSKVIQKHLNMAKEIQGKLK